MASDDSGNVRRYNMLFTLRPKINFVRVAPPPKKRKHYSLKTLHMRRQSCAFLLFFKPSLRRLLASESASFQTAVRNRFRSPWRKTSSASSNEGTPFASVCAKTVWSGCRRHWFDKVSNKHSVETWRRGVVGLLARGIQRLARSRVCWSDEIGVSVVVIGWDQSVSRSASWRSGSAVPPPRCLCVWSLEDQRRIKPRAPNTGERKTHVYLRHSWSHLEGLDLAVTQIFLQKRSL